MIDQWGRSIHYLRLSLTERCTLKCTYCRADEGKCLKKKELGADSFFRIACAMSELGVRKIRLTGGEPLLRRDIFEIISMLRSIPGIEEITMTTNAQMLKGMTGRLREAGLSRLNISIDSLDEDVYRAMTGGGELKLVLEGLKEAVQNGLLPIKINVVLVRGQNDGEIDRFIGMTKDMPIHVRFIELMPMGEDVDVSKRVLSDDILRERPYLIPVDKQDPAQAATVYRIEKHIGLVGFISPVSHKFCGACNRVRVMSDGMLRSCLAGNGEVSLLPALQDKKNDFLKAVIRSAVYYKPTGHQFEKAEFCTSRNMSQIGG